MLPIGMIAGGIGAIAKLGLAAHQNKLAKRVVVPEANYTVSPYAQNTLDLAKQMYNSRMAGASAAERNLYANNANANASVMRGATDSSQALAMMAAIGGQTDQSFNNLAAQEGQWKMNAYGNLAGANAGMTNEMDKVYQDAVRRQQMAMNEKNALRGSAIQNFGGGMNDIINSAWMFDMRNKDK